MAQFAPIVASLDRDRFAEVLTASPRASREQYFHRHGIRAPKSRGVPRAGAKNAFRVGALFDALQQAPDEALCEELLRAWLLTRRPLLAAALDRLGIAHQDGLTDSDEVRRLEGLDAAAAGALYEHLCGVAAAWEVRVYLRFMGTPEAVLPAAPTAEAAASS